MLSFDVEPFRIGDHYLRGIILISAELYLLILHGSALIRVTQLFIDKTDIFMLVLAGLGLVIDLMSLILEEIGISAKGICVRVVWSLTLYYIHLQFVVEPNLTKKIFALTVCLLGVFTGIWVEINSVIPLKHILLVIYVLILGCACNQWYLINRILSKGDDSQGKKKEISQQLLERERIYVISPQLKYHLCLRRSFCIVVTCSLLGGYFFLWNLTESRDSIGEVLVILLIEVIPLTEYYFFVCGRK